MSRRSPVVWSTIEWVSIVIGRLYCKRTLLECRLQIRLRTVLCRVAGRGGSYRRLCRLRCAFYPPHDRLGADHPVADWARLLDAEHTHVLASSHCPSSEHTHVLSRQFQILSPELVALAVFQILGAEIVALAFFQILSPERVALAVFQILGAELVALAFFQIVSPERVALAVFQILGAELVALAVFQIVNCSDRLRCEDEVLGFCCC
jgi:hypothetical protein